jgi:hypothetical protein
MSAVVHALSNRLTRPGIGDERESGDDCDTQCGFEGRGDAAIWFNTSPPEFLSPPAPPPSPRSKAFS